jgi:Tfp pilus assembly protein PilX
MALRRFPPSLATRSRGAALVMSLIVLGVLMLLGVSAVILSRSQFKLAGNVQFQTLALTDAENAMTQAERWTTANWNDPGFTTKGTLAGVYPKDTAPDPLTMKWDDTNSIKVDSDGNQRYVVELYMDGRTLPTSSAAQCNNYGTPGPCPTVNVYRISTRGASRLGAAKVIQALYAVRTGSK